MRHEDSIDVWRQKYGNSVEQWLKQAVAPDLASWGFNTLGWVQEVVTINDQNHRHSRNFTFEEYQWLDMPYCHLLPFIESHQWEIETKLPDITSQGFADWCDYVARDHCTRFRDDPKLIGYFYTDCPTWVHSREHNEWKAPLFDPERLESQSGRDELHQLASTYYKTLHDAVKRYDPNHLILGDRYEALAPLPEQVVQAALPYVDVLSFQCFDEPEPTRDHLKRWADFGGKPVLLADAARWKHVEDRSWPPTVDREHSPESYQAVMDAIREVPECVGYHLCGAYLKNNARRFGFKDRFGTVEPFADEMARVNRSVAKWVDETTASSKEIS